MQSRRHPLVATFSIVACDLDAGDWGVAAGLYAAAAQAEPHRASYQASLVRARWRAAHRRWLDVESLDDGGPDVVSR